MKGYWTDGEKIGRTPNPHTALIKCPRVGPVATNHELLDQRFAGDSNIANPNLQGTVLGRKWAVPCIGGSPRHDVFRFHRQLSPDGPRPGSSVTDRGKREDIRVNGWGRIVCATGRPTRGLLQRVPKCTLELDHGC